MVLILGDYLGPQGVGEGENCVYFTDEEALVLVLRGGLCVYSQKGEGDITSLVEVNQACLLFLGGTNRAPRV